MSSFDVLRKLRKILNIRKIGHIGTLDPLASGCLLVATENSTKLIYLLEWWKKRYQFSVDMSGITDSLDAGTTILPVDTRSFREWIPDGEIIQFLLSQKSQIPPKYSALHIDGKRSYALARKGIDFDIPERTIEITDAILHERKKLSLSLEVTISSGGYIRSLAPLLWDYHGVEWGYITALRRTQLFFPYGGTISVNEASTLDALVPISISRLFPTIPILELSDTDWTRIQNGLEVQKEKYSHHIEAMNHSLLFCKEWDHFSLCEIDGASIKVLKNMVH